MHFNAKIFIHPGLGNSGAMHWQSLWENEFPEFIRINQREWDTPNRQDWVSTIDQYLGKSDLSNTIIVGHSLACCTIAYWAEQYKRKIKGALLVAPSDTEAESYPKGTTGFTPMPISTLPFPSITVTSENDFYVSLKRAEYFANNWGSELVNIGNAGHINAASGLGLWESGLELLKRLDQSTVL